MGTEAEFHGYAWPTLTYGFRLLCVLTADSLGTRCRSTLNSMHRRSSGLTLAWQSRQNEERRQALPIWPSSRPRRTSFFT